MKIAFIGKGGSGKSTVSWLVTRMLAASGRNVLAIDADHNMDFVSLLGQSVGSDTPTMHRHAADFRYAVKQREDTRWHEIVLDNRELPTFTLEPKDAYTAKLALPVSEGIELIAVGLGAEDVLFSDRCAHGHSASLKFYLPLLDEGERSDVIVDGVAGADMMNFGLFLGTDAVVAVVEPHQNSVRVLEQVAEIAKKTGVPFFIVINKEGTNVSLADDIELTWKDMVLARIPTDVALLAYDFEHLSEKTLRAGEQLIASLRVRAPREDKLERLRAFERKKVVARGK